MPNTTAWPSWPASTAPLRSRLPVSTATARWTGLVWPSSAPMTCGSHAAPSCATITAVTTCWGYVSFGDKGSACSSGGHPQFRRAHRRHRPRGPGTSCTICEVTTRGRPDGALRGIRAGQPSGAGPDARHGPTAPADNPLSFVTQPPNSSRRQRLQPAAPGHAEPPDRLAAARSRYTASRFSLRRSRSDSPPQIPNLSSCSSAYSRHSARTSQLRHTRFASLVDPPFSGKNASGSVCAQRARSCQPTSPASSSSMPNPSCTSETMTSATAHPPLPNPVGSRPAPGGRENYMGEITPACLAVRQERYVIMAAGLASDDGKVRREILGSQHAGTAAMTRMSAARPSSWRPAAAFPGTSRGRRSLRRCQPRPTACETSGMRITVLAGGIGAARFLRGLKAAAPDAEITVVGNTGDDISLFGLHVSPDLDTVMYTLGGGISEEQGWGRAGETYAVLAELAEYGAGPDWFSLGDRDLATHITRTKMLNEGSSLTAVTRRLCERWQPGVTLLPMSDDRVETRVVLDDGQGRRTVPFQEWWVRLHAAVPATEITAAGAAGARPAPGVLEAIEAADFVLLPPSNPVVSIGIILAVPGIAEAVSAKTVVGISPIIGGAPVRGMADACLTAIGVQTSATAVAAHYGAGLLDGWLVDEQDKAAADAPELAGIAVRALPLYMTDLSASAEIARAALALAAELTR